MTEITNEMWEKAIEQLQNNIAYYEDYHYIYEDYNSTRIIGKGVKLRYRYHVGERSDELYKQIEEFNRL